MAASRRRAARVMPGAICLRSFSHFSLRPYSNSVKPVVFPIAASSAADLRIWPASPAPRELVHVNTRAGYGNFHMKPNGVFYIAVGKAAVAETHAFLKQRPQADLATQ